MTVKFCLYNETFYSTNVLQIFIYLKQTITKFICQQYITLQVCVVTNDEAHFLHMRVWRLVVKCHSSDIWANTMNSVWASLHISSVITKCWDWIVKWRNIILVYRAYSNMQGTADSSWHPLLQAIGVRGTGLNRKVVGGGYIW